MASLYQSSSPSSAVTGSSVASSMDDIRFMRPLTPDSGRAGQESSVCMESAAGRGALDSLSGFVHGDAIGMEMASHFVCGKGDVPDIYTKPFGRALVPGERWGWQRVKHGYPLPASREFRDVPNRCVQTACRMDLFTRAKELGIQTEFIDGQGHRHVTDAAALKIILDALPVRLPHRFLGEAVVVRSGPALADRTQRGCHVPAALENPCRP